MENLKSPKVSVVIPVYNVEGYLDKCLKSVASQTYDNFECILIIDGSTDRSYEVAKAFCESDGRFSVYYQDNAGSGPARNNGVARSTGDFVCFIDPDDWVEDNYIETLVVAQQKNDYDLVISQSIDRRINSDDEIVNTKYNAKPILSYSTQEKCRQEFPRLMFNEHYLDGPICKLFKMSIIRNNNIQFPDYRRSQDMVFNFRYYNCIASVVTIPDNTYNIRYEYPPRQGRGRVFTGYHEIVAKINEELSAQLEEWELKQDYKTDLNTWSFWYIIAHIYKCVEAGVAYGYVRQEPFVKIVRMAKPRLLMHKVIRYCLKCHQYKVLNGIIKMVNKFR